MENASKALIIAGAIILGILIIGLGMAVFNQAREAMSGANLDSEKAQAFNSKFTDYTGSKVTGIQLKSLIDLVIANNNTSDTTENPRISMQDASSPNVTSTLRTAIAAGVTSSSTAAEVKAYSVTLASYRNAIKNSDRYTVTVLTYDSAGRITKIKAKKNS